VRDGYPLHQGKVKELTLPDTSSWLSSTILANLHQNNPTVTCCAPLDAFISKIKRSSLHLETRGGGNSVYMAMNWKSSYAEEGDVYGGLQVQ